ncbi:MAG TPA: hypothetical protein VIM84_06650 [Gemmatimonadales bacterium]
MKASIRRIIEMGNRVLAFSRAHPDPSPGYAAALARLEKGLAEADVLAARQREGINTVRAATSQKRALRRKMRRTQLVHLARVAESAAAEVPDLAQKFRLVREGVPYLAFRTAARGMLAEAESQKELLVKHGLFEASLASLSQSLGEFEQAVEQGIEGRRAHVGASAELEALADELLQVVRLMDGSNRYRFPSDPESLAQWESARNVIGPPRGQSVARSDGPPPPQGGEVKPAA